MSHSIGQSGPQLRPLTGPGTLNGTPPSTQGGSGGMSNIQTAWRVMSPPPQQRNGGLALTIVGQQRPRSSGHAPPPVRPSVGLHRPQDSRPLAVQHSQNDSYNLVATDSESNAHNPPPLATAPRGGTGDAPFYALRSSEIQGGSPPPQVANANSQGQIATPKPLMTREAFRQSAEATPRLSPIQERAYNHLLGKIEAFDKSANTNTISTNAGNRTAIFEQTMRALNELEQSARHFGNLNGHATGSVTALHADIAATRDALINLKSDRSIAWDKVNGGQPMTMKQATELARLGMKPGPDTRFEPGHGDTALTGGLDDFAHGMNNVVARVKYENGDERILKPEIGQRGKWETELTMGIPQKNPGYAARSLATSVVDTVIGTNVIPKTSLAIHNGALNLSMEVVPGRLGKRPWIDQPVPFKLQEELRQMKTDVSAERFTQELNNRGVRELPGGIPPSFQFIGKFATNIDPRDPALMQQMNKLEWLDCITGQADRHADNMLVEFADNRSFVGLKGIDNDTAFGKNWHDMDNVAANKSRSNQYRGNGLPSFVDADVARILTDPHTWPELSDRLSKLISPEELQATKERFDAAVTKVNGLMQGDQMVSDWHDRALMVQGDVKNSYAATFARVHDNFHVANDVLHPPRDFNNVVPISAPRRPVDDVTDVEASEPRYN